MWKVSNLVEEEIQKTYYRQGNTRKSHFLCIDALVSRHKPLLMLSKEYIDTHPLDNDELTYTAPNISQQIGTFTRLLEDHTTKKLKVYHKAMIHLHFARALLATYTQPYKGGEGKVSKQNWEKMIESHLTSANNCAIKMIHNQKLDVTSEECVPMNDIIDAVQDINSWLFARKIFLEDVEEVMMDVGHDSSSFTKPMLYLENIESVSDYTQDLDPLASQSSEQVEEDGSINESDTTKKAINNKFGNADEQDQKSPEPSVEAERAIDEYQVVDYEDMIEMAQNDPQKKVYLTDVELGAEPFTMADAKIIHGFLYYFKRDRLGLSNLMNIYLDKMDANLDFNTSDVSKLTQGLMAMGMGGIMDDSNVFTPSSPSTETAPSSLSTPSTPKFDANSASDGMKSRKRRKIVEEVEEEEL